MVGNRHTPSPAVMTSEIAVRVRLCRPAVSHGCLCGSVSALLTAVVHADSIPPVVVRRGAAMWRRIAPGGGVARNC